jgi:hypothetical protein
MRTRLLPLLILLAGLSAPFLQARADAERQRVPTVTRLVQLFSTLEIELMTAVQQGDAPAIGKMLADDFELRSGATPGTPTPRAEWLKQSQGQAAAPIEQMAVHDYGAAAVVSYMWKRGVRLDVFVVDVWAKSGDGWKLSVRYASPAGNP